MKLFSVAFTDLVDLVDLSICSLILFIIVFMSAQLILRHSFNLFVFVSEVLAGIRRSAGAVSISSTPFFVRRTRNIRHGLCSFSAPLKLPCNQVTFMEESYIAGANPNSKQVLFSFRIYLISFQAEKNASFVANFNQHFAPHPTSSILYIPTESQSLFDAILIPSVSSSDPISIIECSITDPHSSTRLSKASSISSFITDVLKQPKERCRLIIFSGYEGDATDSRQSTINKHRSLDNALIVCKDGCQQLGVKC